MSSFTTPLVVEYDTGLRLWVLDEPFEYHVGEHPSDEVIEVPTGFYTDFASIPKIFHWILPPDGLYTKAAVVHDFLYATQDHCYSRNRSDHIFYEAMEVLGVVRWQRRVMFYWVRAFGWYPWYRRRWMHKKYRWES